MSAPKQTPNHRPLRLGMAERVVTMLMRRMLPYGLSAQPVSLDALPPAREGGVYALYLHVPFCETLCPYCSFHKIPFQAELADRYFDSLEKEMHLAADLGYKFDTLYVGGGTPTVMPDRLVGVLKLASELFGVKHGSRETHAHHRRPEVAGRLAGHVKRLSVGVQTLDAGILRRMRRDPDHFTPQETLEGIRAMNGQFQTLNVDLIFNIPGQSIDGVMNDLDRVLETGVRQVTTYPLMSSRKVSRDMQRQLGKNSTSNEYEMFRRIEERLLECGMRASSPWCYSRQEEGMIDEYIVDAPEYVGLGSGAFSLLDGGLYVNTFSVSGYSERVNDGKMSVERMRRFKSWEWVDYRLMMGLVGLDLDRVGLGAATSGWSRGLLRLELLLLKMAGAFQPGSAGRFALSHSGRYLSLAMMREFFAGMNQVRDESRAMLPAWQRGDPCEGASEVCGNCPVMAAAKA